METQTLQAKFTDQEQAESAVRKLASLRGNNFRLERTHSRAHADAAFITEFASMDAPVESFGWTQNAGDGEAASFSLSAVIPVMAAEQARRVVREHGGELV